MLIKILGFITLLFLLQTPKVNSSIDLMAAHTLIADSRLPRELAPTSYNIDLHPFIEEGRFNGRVKINVTWHETTNRITLHVHNNLMIYHSDIIVTQFAADDDTVKRLSGPHTPTVIKLIRTELTPKKPMYIIYLQKSLKRGAQCEIDIPYTGTLNNETSDGFFRNHYIDATTGEKKWFVATNFRPNMARRVFPCFDEPAFKARFTISLVRNSTMTSLSNMPLIRSEPLQNDSKWTRDYFEQTPPMSTFAVGFLISDFTAHTYNTSSNDNLNLSIRVWARPDFLDAVRNVTQKIYYSLKALQYFWAVQFPMPKLDCVALPNFQGNRPSDGWGLVLFKESELSSKGTWQITHEMVYQWLGALATPYWWSDAHVNNALARYIATYITLKISHGRETFHNWPMTMLYSIYYEFSKRYPHGKVMAIKQDSASTKTELLFRMLNYTLSEDTLNQAFQRFMYDRQHKTFFGDDVWGTITQQARHDKTLNSTITVNEIAGSWIAKDRLPVVNVTRNYTDNTAIVTQRVYLRERPHDVPDQEKFLWWIPIVLIREDKLNFTNSTPLVWMRKERQISLTGLPEHDKFIIVNPEEIGPFPVNYDTTNWNLLVDYLQTDDGRQKIPVNTRAKLLHDAWNLAYAGDLNFATALNMTLFLKKEREHLAWDPVFTMIDHIGRHIDSSSVHKKFLTYVRMLLTPLYEELGNEPQEEEDEGITNLRSSSKIFLCQAGYKPCIEEAQAAFHKWMESENPDEGNPVANQYICPVFKWGTKEEWEFGLQRVLNFPASRKQNERTYLLKTLAGCPIDSWKIEKILNITILEHNGNFTDNDIYLIFSMLTGGSSGYTALFNYLKSNWNAIKKSFENKPQLWNSLITSSTSVFKTQEGLDMVSGLYLERQGEFGTAEFVIEKALKNIKEEAKWSDDNLPVIEAWLDNYLKNNNGDNEKNNKFL